MKFMTAAKRKKRKSIWDVGDEAKRFDKALKKMIRLELKRQERDEAQKAQDQSK